MLFSVTLLSMFGRLFASPIQSSMDDVASEMSSFLDEAIDPCEDFYQFSCGGFEKKKQIPDDMVGISTISDMNSNILKQIIDVLKDDIGNDDCYGTKLAKQFFKMCMDEEKLKYSNVDVLNSKIKRINCDDDLETTIVNIYAVNPYSAFMFFDIYIEVNGTDNTKRMIKITPPNFPLPASDITAENNPKMQALKQLYEDIAGANFKVKADEIENIMELLQNLAEEEKVDDSSEQDDLIPNEMQLGDFINKYPYFDWSKLLNVMFQNITVIEEDEIVFVAGHSYFDRLGQIMDNTPESTLVQYTLFYFISYNLKYLNPELHGLRIKYEGVTKGITKPVSRNNFCSFQANDLLPFAVGNLYVKNYFDNSARDKIEEIIASVKAEFKYSLNLVDWMDENTKREAINKLEKMAWMIGYVPEVINETMVAQFYDDINFETVGQNFYEYMSMMERFLERNKLKGYLQTVNRLDWKEHNQIAVANAFHIPIGNKIVFPAGVLQTPYFSPSYPQYMNFGGIGALIGHELTHGFDYNGRYYDSNGNRRDWWDEETVWEYEDKAFCIIEQYNNFIEPNTNMAVNGVNTLDENIADNGGFKYAYKAYQKWIRFQKRTERQLPHFKYDQNQTFWITLAQKYCAVQRKQFIETDMKTGQHSPARFRVNGALSNNKYFAKDFHCSVGSAMVRNNTCVIW